MQKPTPTPDEPGAPYAAEIRKLRAAAGLTQIELAERLGLGDDPQAARRISKWETGQRSPSKAALFAIRAACETPRDPNQTRPKMGRRPKDSTNE